MFTKCFYGGRWYNYREMKIKTNTWPWCLIAKTKGRQDFLCAPSRLPVFAAKLFSVLICQPAGLYQEVNYAPRKPFNK
jgi:hypothetical protein